MADTTENDGPEENDIFGGEGGGAREPQQGESLDEILRNSEGGAREDRSIANIHTGSKTDHVNVVEEAPPEGAPPPEPPIVTPGEYTPGDPPPPIDPIDVPQQAAGDFQPEERPLDFELRARVRDQEGPALEEQIEEEVYDRPRGDDARERAETFVPTQPEEATVPNEPFDDRPSVPLANDAVLDEDDLSGGTDGSGVRSITQPLIIEYGDDGAGSVRLQIPADLADMEIGQGGTPLSLSLSEDGSQIVAVDSEDKPVFSVTLNESGGNYSYTFELQGAIDHGDLEQVDLPIGISVTDADGDVAIGEFMVGIVDDAPVARDDVTQEIEEGGGVVGSDNGAANLLDNDELGADGALIFQFTYTDENGEEQTARAGDNVDTEHGTLYVNADGSWTFEADPSADHSDGTVMDGFTYSIVDADGDTSSATQNIQITDDGPTIDSVDDGPGGGDNATLFEKDIEGDGASITQSLNIEFGADGEGSVALAIPQDLIDLDLTADGQPVEYALSEDGQSIVATAGGDLAFTMSLNQGEGGEHSYTFELQGNLDHPGAGSDILSNLPFEIKVTDGDGSTATAEVNINVVDDQPEAVGEITLTLEEGGNTVGSANGGANLLANDDLGADAGEITSITYIDENGQEQSATLGETGVTVDTQNGQLSVQADGTWTFTADENADHSGAASVMEGFTYTVTDGDGDTSSATQNIQITDTGPELPPAPPSPPPPGGYGDGDQPDLGRADLIVDEANMGAEISQSIDVDFGQDGFGAAALSIPTELEDMNLTSGGEAISYAVSEDGQSITASANGEAVFTVALDANAETGELSYSVTLDGAVDHPSDGVGDDLLSNLPVTLTVTDGDGTTATTNLEIGIIDDTPEAQDDATVRMDEGGETLNVAADQGLLANDDLGADGSQITAITFVDENGQRQSADLGEDGVTVDTENGQLTVQADGSWSFETDPSADHSGGDIVTDSFTYTITDGDGDTSQATQSIEITDDGPVIGQPPGATPPGDGGDNPNAEGYSVTVDEDDLGNGAVDGGQSLNIDFGADGEGSVTLDIPQELKDMNITSGGEAVTFAVSDDGQSVVGSTADGSPVLAISLQESNGDYSYGVDLYESIDHVGEGADDVLSDIPVTLTVTDGDGDSASATLTVNVIDDAPEAIDDGTFDVADGGQVIGTEAGQENLLGNDDLGSDGAAITSITYTDEDGQTQSVEVGENGVSVDTEQGALTVNPDGTWAFESDTQMESPDGAPVLESFTYTITDGDGESSTANVSLNITDGTAQPPEFVIGEAIGYEDKAIPLNIETSLTDTDGSESLSITLSDIPNGAVLMGGDGNEIAVTNGSVSLAPEDLEGLSITPPTDSDVDFDLSVSLTSTELSTGDTNTVETSVTVEVDAVADATTVSASVDAKVVTPEAAPVVIDTHNFGDTDSGFRVVGRDVNGEIDADNVVTSGGALGVGGSAVDGRSVVPNQIGHNPDTGEAEGLIVEFDNNVTQVDFSVSRLFQDEGDKRGDASGDEQGKVILYRDGEIVGEIEFTAEDRHTGSFTVQADDGGPFDAIEFTATEYSEGDGTQTSDSSDYFVDQISYTPAPEPGLEVEQVCEVTVNVDATFGDFADGSENHFVVVQVPEGWEPQGDYVNVDSTNYGEGNFIAIQVDPTDLQETGGSISVPVTFITPLPDEDGAVDINVFAVAQEVNIDGTVGDGEITLDNNNFMSWTSVTLEKEDIVAEDPNLTVDDAIGYEDQAIALNIDAGLSDTDGSESLSIMISDVPEGAVLSAGTDNGDGTWSLEQADLDGLTVTPPIDSDVDFDLKVSVTSTEDGSNDSATVETTINVSVDAVADDTSVTASVDATLVPGDEGAGLADVTVTNEGMESAAFNNTYGYYIKDEDGNPSEGGIVFANTKEGVGDSFTIEDVDPDNIGFFIIPNGDKRNGGLENGDAVTFEQDDSGEWHVVGPDGDRLVGQGDPALFSDPGLNENNFDYTQDNDIRGNQNWEDLNGGGDRDFNDVNMNVEVMPNEGEVAHCDITVNVDATFGDYSDGSERHFVVVEVPTGWQPTGEFVEVDGSAYGEGEFIAIPVDAADLAAGNGSVNVPVSFTSPVPDDDGSIKVNVFAVAQEVNIDGTVGDGEITLDNNNTMSATTIEVQKEDLVAEDPTLQVDDASGYEDQAIALNIDAGLTDTDGSETLSITISDVPEGATLSAGTDNGDGTWSLEQGDLEGLTVTPPTDSDVDFDLSISVTSTEDGSGDTSTVEATVNVEVDAVADATSVSAEVTATVTPGEPGETEEITIGAENYDAADAGFTVAGRTIDADGNLTDASTDQISVKSTGNPTGFGVKGDVGNGADSEIGYEDGKSEQVVINFDEDVSSADVTIAWQNPNEDCRVTLYRDGEPVGEVIVEGGTDRVDGLGAFTADDGGLFDSMVFEATGENSDFLIHEVKFETAGEPAPATCDVQIDVTASFGDYTDGSEEHFVFVEVPAGMTPTDGDLQVVEGNSENGLSMGQTFVAIPIDVADIQDGNGTVSVPVSFTGEVPAEDGSINANVFAGAVETNLDGGEITFTNNNSLSSTSVEIETKDMVVEDPTLSVEDASGYEDQAIALNIDAGLSDTDGSETLSITISDVPEGATLSAGTDNGDGTWSLEHGDLKGLTVTPPTDSDIDFDLSVAVTSTETSTGEASTLEQSISVEVDAVADATSVSATVDAQLVEGEAGEGTAFTLGGRETDGSKSEMFDSFDQEVGGHNISVTAIKVDGSEGKLDGDVKGGEWRGIGVKGEGDSEIDFDKGGDGGSEQIAIDFDGMELNELTVGVKALFNEGEVADGQESGRWVAYHDGEPVASGDFHAADDSGATDGALEIKIGPDDLGEGVVFDEVRFEASEAGSDFLIQYVEGEQPGAPGEPHCDVTVNVDATFGDFEDGSENHFVFVEIPEGWNAPEGATVVSGDEIDGDLSGGTYVQIEVPAETIAAGDGSVEVPVQFIAPADVETDIQIDIYAGAQETNLDGQELTDDNNFSLSGNTITVPAADMAAAEPVVVDQTVGDEVAETAPGIIEENFDDGVSGWGNEAEGVNGEMMLEKDETATKTFDFGAERAGQTVTIEFDTETQGSWDEGGRLQDTFSLTANGEELVSTSEGGEQSHSVTVTLDDNGQVQLEMNADTTGRDEGISIDNLKITSEEGETLVGEAGAEDTEATVPIAQTAGVDDAAQDDGTANTLPADEPNLALEQESSSQEEQVEFAGAPDGDELSSGDIAAGLEKFSAAPPIDDGGNQDAFVNVGAGSGSGDQGSWFDENSQPDVDDEVFGKTELEQKEDDDQKAEEAAQEEQDQGIQIPAEGGENEADFEDRSLV